MNTISALEIKYFLENTPLYTQISFKHSRFFQYSLHINEVDAYCNTCNSIRPFHDLRSRGSGLGASGMPPKLNMGQTHFNFTCVSCKTEHREYLVDYNVNTDDDTITLQKYGELPRMQLERDKLLLRFFSDDASCYEKAVVSLGNGYGIGAFAYLRRIVERNISKLLNMLQEDINCYEENRSITSALTELRKESPMSEKIKIANNALPDYLKLNGINPLGKLYKILSEGVHQLSDEECLEKATAVKECLKYLISELTTRKLHRDKFSKIVGSL